MDSDAQRTAAAWSVILLGFAGCGVAFALIDGADVVTVLGWYAIGIAMAVVAGAVPLPGALGRWHPLGD